MENELLDCSPDQNLIENVFLGMTAAQFVGLLKNIQITNLFVWKWKQNKITDVLI